MLSFRREVPLSGTPVEVDLLKGPDILSPAGTARGAPGSAGRAERWGVWEPCLGPHVQSNRVGEGRMVAGRGNATGGKSGLHRAGCWVTPRGGNATDQCHRKQTAGSRAGKGETVR